MDIIHISAEFAPFAQAGGLGEALNGLCKAQANDNNHVEVLIPCYAMINIPKQAKLISVSKIEINFGSNVIIDSVSTYKIENYTVSLIGSDHHMDFFKRSNIYGYDDDALRFIYFCKAASCYLQNKPKLTESIINCHDWHASTIIPILKELGAFQTNIVLTIHNFGYQGYCPTSFLDNIELNNTTISLFKQKSSLDYSNILKAGILSADYITTVSKTYAVEILDDYKDPDACYAINSTKQHFCGIMNGIDYTKWNPETDINIKRKYSTIDLSKPKEFVNAKAINKRYLQKKLKLNKTSSIMFGVISRLVEQKGLNFIKQSIIKAIENNAQIVILGSCFDNKTHLEFINLSNEFRKSKNVKIILTFSNELAHLIYAGADCILMPSIFEPCGLTQLIAMKYGSIPLAHKTGGIADSVLNNETGFIFDNPTEQEFSLSMDAALKTFNYDPSSWYNIVYNCMHKSFSWAISAKEYICTYMSILSANPLLNESPSSEYIEDSFQGPTISVINDISSVAID